MGKMQRRKRIIRELSKTGTDRRLPSWRSVEGRVRGPLGWMIITTADFVAATRKVCRAMRRGPRLTVPWRAADIDYQVDRAKDIAVSITIDVGVDRSDEVAALVAMLNEHRGEIEVVTGDDTYHV